MPSHPSVLFEATSPSSLPHTLPGPPTADWLADVYRSFEAALIALEGGLLPPQILPEQNAGHMARLLTPGEWKAVIDAARAAVSRPQRAPFPAR